MNLLSKTPLWVPHKAVCFSRCSVPPPPPPQLHPENSFRLSQLHCQSLPFFWTLSFLLWDPGTFPIPPYRYWAPHWIMVVPLPFSVLWTEIRSSSSCLLQKMTMLNIPPTHTNISIHAIQSIYTIKCCATPSHEEPSKFPKSGRNKAS